MTNNYHGDITCKPLQVRTVDCSMGQPRKYSVKNQFLGLIIRKFETNFHQNQHAFHHNRSIFFCKVCIYAGFHALPMQYLRLWKQIEPLNRNNNQLKERRHLIEKNWLARTIWYHVLRNQATFTDSSKQRMTKIEQTIFCYLKREITWNQW